MNLGSGAFIRRRRAGTLAVLLALTGSVLLASEPPVRGAVVEPGFRVDSVFDDYAFDTPTALAFGADGRIFVTERGGRILAFDGMADPTPTVVMDLSSRVHAVGDRGLLGLAVHPDFPASPYIYVTYILDAPISGSPVPFYDDLCPPSPNGAKDGCPAPGRLSRIQVGADSRAVGAEQVLIGGQFWCHAQQGHALDHVAFGPDGALYVSSGEGAAGSFQDYGQHSGATGGVTPNACGDPPVTVGERLTLPTTQGGALRAQDLLTSNDPTSGNGAIIRVDPATGAALPDNPLVGNAVADDDRHIAHGLRNPFRFTFRPGTSELWIGDVGWNTWEEVNVIPDPTDSVVENFGWPCHEGSARNTQWDNLNVDLCEELYAGQHGGVTSPRWAYRHSASPDAQRCGNAGSAISGIAFGEGAPYPAAYDGALFVADYVKGCLWALPAGSNGLPNPAGVHTILSGVAPVDLELGPDGRLYFVDIAAGTVNRVDYAAGNAPPVARVSATPASGPVPLTVSFSASASTDDQPVSQLSYAWDLDGDGAYDDATGVTAGRTYTASGSVLVRVRVTDGAGASDVAQVTIQAGNSPPVAQITRPTTADRWSTGVDLPFAGTASDPNQPGIGASSMRWSMILYHCVTQTDCHAHPQGDRVGVASGVFNAPEHDYPAYLEFRLTVTDAGGLTDTDTVRVDPRTVQLTFSSEPAGLQLAAGLAGGSPLTITAISGSRTVISAPSPQVVNGISYTFSSWSDGGAASHDVIAGTSNASYVARFVATGATVVRRAGADRYATAAALSAATFPRAAVVHVATGRDYPDALGAGAAAAARGGPVLLTDRAFVPAATMNELRRLDPAQIVIVGGTSVVSSAVETQLRSTGATVVRRAGADRYATAAALSAATFPRAAVVHVATGRDYPDALGAGAAAAARGGPVLLTDRAFVPAATMNELRRLDPAQIVIVGGTSVVSSAVETQLRSTGATVVRRAGADRYATAAALSAATFPRAAVVHVATGRDYPDALGAGAAAAARGGPVLLTDRAFVPAATMNELRRLDPAQIVIVGGTSVVSSAVETQLDPT